jgi:branched-chain amino acid transport system permease protein
VSLRRVSPGIALTTAAMIVVGVGGPLVVDQFGLLQLTVFASMCILALSLGVVWGYGGILCFGQSAFFGLGAYTYAVTAVNLGESTVGIVLSVLVPGVFAALLGYFMFYGRLSDVYLGVITLSVTLIFFNLMNSTAGDVYRVGTARLNGFNGMPSLPTFNVPGNPGRLLDPTETFYLVMALLLASGAARHAGEPLVAWWWRCARTDALRAARLRRAPAQAAHLHAGGGIAAGRQPLRQLGRLREPQRLQPGHDLADHHLGHRGGLGTLGGPIIGCLIMQYLATELGTAARQHQPVFGIIFQPSCCWCRAASCRR